MLKKNLFTVIIILIALILIAIIIVTFDKRIEQIEMQTSKNDLFKLLLKDYYL